MAPLDKNLFTGGNQIDGSDLAKTEVQNMGIGVDAVLKQFGGKGKATGCVVLHLSPDNHRVDKAKWGGGSPRRKTEVGNSLLHDLWWLLKG